MPTSFTKPGYRIYLWFALRDLTDRRSRYSTVGIFLGLFISFNILVISLAAPEIMEIFRKKHLAENPRALSLEFDKGPMETISVEDQEKLVKAINEDPSLGVQGLYFYSQANYYFPLPEGSKQYTGRVVHENDLVVRAAGADLNSLQGKPWIMVRDVLKEEVKYAFDQNKKEFRVNHPVNNLPIALNFAGYFSKDYYSFRDFMISEKAVELINKKPTSSCKWVLSGPIPMHWNPQIRPQALEDYLDANEIRNPLMENFKHDGQEIRCWRLSSRIETGIKEPAWRDHLENIKIHMDNKYGKSLSNFVSILKKDDSIKVENPESFAKKSVPMGVLYVKDLSFLTNAIQKIKSLGVRPTNPEAEAQLREIHNSTNYNKRIMVYLNIGVMLIVACNSFFLEFLRLNQKTPEIGLLKSFGVFEANLLCVYLTESVILFFISLLAGIGLALTLLVVGGKGFLFPWLNFGEIFDSNYFYYLIIFAVFNFCIVLFSTWVGSAESRNNCPAHSLSKGE